MATAAAAEIKVSMPVVQVVACPTSATALSSSERLLQ